MKLHVHKAQREAKMRAHTATHLLHHALDTLLGGTKQAGSLVDQDYLRFDFACPKGLSPEQLNQIEQTINSRIAAGYDVETTESSLQEAQKTGAKAFFEDTYGEMVRVVRIASAASDGDLHSIELCGGTHVLNTSHIGACKIVSHTSVASGIRRIEAYTGVKVVTYAQSLHTRLTDIASRLDCQPKQLEEKLEKMLKEYAHLQSDHESLQGQIIGQHLDESHMQCELPAAGSAWGTGCIINTSETDLSHHSFKEIVLVAKSRWSDRNWIIYNNEGNFAIYTGTGSLSARQFSKDQGLQGGGSDQFVQGKDSNIINIVS